MEVVGELLRDAAARTDVGRVAEAFDHVDVPASLAHAFGLDPEDDRGSIDPVEVPGGRVVVLAGPGVVAGGNIGGLRAFAARANVPIANTWGAKGVLPWDSPQHMGTCGLQARDFELLGFADYDAIVTTGIDPRESPPERFSLGPVVDIPPGDLGRVAEKIARSADPIAANELYERLSAIAQPGYTDDRVPLHPARAVGDLRATLPPGGVITADPGLAGLWVARTFPTTEPGTVVVPALATPGIAAALALVSSLRGLPAVAVTNEPLDHTTLAVLELATELAAAFVLDVWGPGASIRRAGDHLEQLQAATHEPGVSIVDVPVNRSLTRKLVDAAGPVVAWGGVPVGE